MRFWGTSRVTSAMRGSVAGSRSAPPRGTSPFGTTWMGPRRRSARRTASLVEGDTATTGRMP